MNCEEFRDRLGDPTTLPEVETDDEAMRHVAGCEPCRSWLAYEKQLAGGFTQMGNRQPPVALADRIIGIPAAELRRRGQSAPWWRLWRRSWWPAALAGGAAVLFLAVSLTWLTAPATSPVPAGPRAMRAAAPTPAFEEKAAPAPSPGGPAASTEAVSDTAAGTPAEPAVPPTAPANPAGESVRAAAAGGAAPDGMLALTPPAEPAAQAGKKTSPASEDSSEETSAQATTAFLLAKVESAKDAPPAPALALPPEPVSLGLPKAIPLPLPPLPKSAPGREPGPAAGVALDSADVLYDISPSEAESADGGMPIVRGRPLDEEGETPPPIRVAKAQPAETRPRLAPARPADPFSPKVSPSGPSASRGERLLREGAGESAAGAMAKGKAESRESESFQVARAPAPVFAPPPPRSALALRKETADHRGATPPRDDRHEKIEAVMQEHRGDIREGPLDINQWVISDWISVKERIFLAPPPNFRWVAVKRGQRWEASLQQITP
ncbi:MAG: hypothetical protein GX442_10050 [Candidatus Riflebacteria bacterium]|nr:hypothetical protein [Candidatus Riflebacteria bacterium]